MADSRGNPRTRVRCTYENCGFYFKSEEQMKKHKSRAPEHDYCKKCDEDFSDEESHLIHKIRSTKHVACPMCGEDFKSEGGRDAHIRQSHRADQDITCVGCTAKFVRAGALMAHIENNLCETISSEAYAQERARKAVLKEAVAKALDSNNDLIDTKKIGSDVASDDGGVPVNSNSLLDDPDGRKVKAGSSGGPSSVARSTISVASRKHWPTLGSERNTGNKEQEEDIGDDLMVFSTLSVREGGENHGQFAGNSRQGGLNVGTVTASALPSNFGLDRDSGQMVSTLSKDKWDPTRFFDSCLGEYVCPCGKKFKTLGDFEGHLSSGAHGQGRIRCPACHRIFKTNAALVSHCESASVKCQINQSHNFNGIIQDISGGVIEASGHHIDGTVKYEAGQIIDIQRSLPAAERPVKW